MIAACAGIAMERQGVMADRTSAGVFGAVFEILGEDSTKDHKLLARRVFALTTGYDFSPYQMAADESLARLGLDRTAPDADHPDCVCGEYGPGDGATSDE